MSPLRNALRSNWRWSLPALALVPLALLLAAACGGGDEETPGPTAGQSPGAPTTGESPAATKTSGGNLSEELKSLSEEFASTSAKVSYDFSAISDSQTEDGSMTLYWRLPDWRMDLSTSEGDITMILAGGTSYICGSQLGESQCLSFETPESGLDTVPFQDFVDPEAINKSIAEAMTSVDIDRSEETIAGEKAKCFSVSGTFEGETGASEWCFASDGILLRISGTSGAGGESEFRLEATEISREVSDSDFEPPYPVTEFPDLSMPTPGG